MVRRSGEEMGAESELYRFPFFQGLLFVKYPMNHQNQLSKEGMKKGILSILLMVCLITFISCEKKSTKDDLETKRISIEVSETQLELLERLVDQNKGGQLTFYEDKQCAKAHENFPEALGMKEIIQIPDPMSPGGFIDKIVSIPFNTDRFSKINLTGEFSNGKLTSISAFSATHKLVVDGQELGSYPAFYLHSEELVETNLIEELNSWAELREAKVM